MNARSRLLALAVASLFATAAVAQYAPPPPPPPPPEAQGAIPPPPPPPPMAPAAPVEQQSLPAPPPPPPPPPAEPVQPAIPPMPATDQTMSAPAATGGLTEERSVQFQDAQGVNVTVNYGMPQPDNFGPKPPFSQLDSNHDGRISQTEAQAYLPLYNDWLHVAPHASSISQAQYDGWND